MFPLPAAAEAGVFSVIREAALAAEEAGSADGIVSCVPASCGIPEDVDAVCAEAIDRLLSPAVAASSCFMRSISFLRAFSSSVFKRFAMRIAIASTDVRTARPIRILSLFFMVSSVFLQGKAA